MMDNSKHIKFALTKEDVSVIVDALTHYKDLYALSTGDAIVAYRLYAGFQKMLPEFDKLLEEEQ